MPALTSRPYAGDADREAILALVRAAGRGDLASADVRELLCLPAVQAQTRLWLDESGRPVGYGLVDHFNNLHWAFEQPEAFAAVEADLVAWGADCVRRLPDADDAGEPRSLDASAGEDDPGRIAFLERHGFVRQPMLSLYLERPLDGPLPAPTLPPGFTIRPLDGAREIEAVVALHRAAFGTEYMTVEERRAMMSGPGYDPALDLVAVAPNGRLAAYCLCGIDSEASARAGQTVGYTDPVACHPGFQRRGLARALLLAGCALLQARGATLARLGTSSENRGMQAAAGSAGFQRSGVTLWFARPVDPGGD